MKYSFVLAAAFAVTAIAVPANQQSDGQVLAASVSVKSDGQPTVPTAAPVKQITDGQVQAGAQQKSDGQPIISSAAPAPAPAASQKSDGQPVISSAAPAVSTPAVKQISDGQVQAGASQKSDGQPVIPSGKPAPTANSTISTTSPSASPFTGAGSLVSWDKQVVLAVVGAAAGFALL